MRPTGVLPIAGFSAMLLTTMAMSTFPLFVVAVLASEFRAEFDLSNLQIGLLGAVNTGVGGLIAPYSGRVTDLLGGRRAMGGVLITAGVASALIAVSPSFWWLLGALAIAGVPQGWGNPATNKAIATGIAADQRGLLTGIKQSGVQLAVVIAGVGLPFAVRTVGWRVGLWIAAGVSIAAVAGLRLVTSLDAEENSDSATDSASRAPAQGLPRFVLQVATFGFLMGFVGGGIGRFIPLFAEEEVGFSPQLAGLVFALSGLVAIPMRIGSGVAMDRGASTRRTMIALAIGASISCVMFVFAPTIAALLFVATVINGLTLGSWNTAANLAMIRETGAIGAGRATGVLLFGFLIGLTLGGPAVGWSLDTFDSYNPAWFAGSVACLLAAAAVARR